MKLAPFKLKQSLLSLFKFLKPMRNKRSNSGVNPSLLTLPHDLLLIIIEYLSTDERIEFGRTCKRIQQLSFALGKMVFDGICVSIVS